MKISLDAVDYSKKTPICLNHRQIKTKALSWNLEKPLSRITLEELVHKMVRACLADDGVGLAAPQIGIDKALFIIRDMDANNKELPSFTAYFNPSWSPVTVDGKETMIEGCLSVPGVSASVERWQTIQASWYEFVQDGVFIEKREILTGLRARIFQHEWDHTVAKSILDRVAAKKK